MGDRPLRQAVQRLRARTPQYRFPLSDEIEMPSSVIWLRYSSSYSSSFALGRPRLLVYRSEPAAL